LTTLTLLQEIEHADRGTPDEPNAIEKLILKHAMRSFARRGYAATTLRGIASEVGVTAPLVSYYFKSKENLFVNVAEIVMKSLAAEVEEALETPRSFYGSVVAIVEAHVGILDKCPAAVEFMFSLMYGPQEGQPVLDISGMWSDTRERIAGVFDRAVTAGELVPREGVSQGFLVEQLGNLIHTHVSFRFNTSRLVASQPERRDELERCSKEMSLDVALQHFFFGAGDVPELQGRRS